VTHPVEFPPDARDAILAWYAATGRRLPFRGTTDPYAILVSEAMAQQTQVARVGQAWTRFMDRFPTVEALAVATPADVLREWRGLGYNRRAMALWRAARQIVDRHGGRVPADLDALEELPGVGPYTARAVAAIAFGLPVGAVDTNVRRVLGRVVAGDAGALPAVELQALADATVPPDRPAAWTHAVMDLGATVCRPARPGCATCPARAWCRYTRSMASDRVVPVVPQPRRAPATAPFPSTSRWLRGRILDRLRAAPDGTWVELDRAIGTHDDAAVRRAADALARDGLLELEVGDRDRVSARLPLA
jgi:A/G-specific adenine glycosylase